MPTFLCWRNTTVAVNQVIFYIFSIKCIFYVTWHIDHMLHNLLNIVCFYTEWLKRCQSSIVYERRHAVNQPKSCMSFLCHQYSAGCHLCRSGQQGRYLLRCEENRWNFQVPSAINQRTREMDVGGGTSIAGPCHGEPSNDAFKPLKAIVLS